MDTKSPATNQGNYSEAEAAKQADRLIRQAQASAMAAEAINKAQNSAQNENPRDVRNVRKSPSIDSGYAVNQKGESPHATTDERYRHSAYKDKVLGPAGLNEKAAKPSLQTGKSALQLRPGARTLQNHLANTKLSAPVAVAEALLVKARATQINLGALAWASYVWLAIQVPFAILVMVTLGAVAAIDELTQGEGGWVAWIAGKVVKATQAVINLFGFDLSKMAFDLFLASQVIILTLGLICIFALYMQYKLAGLNPFFGKGASFKIGMFLLALFGYSMPVLNLLPFVFLWMLAVWMYPR